jgi:hypothetical protein
VLTRLHGSWMGASVLDVGGRAMRVGKARECWQGT